MEKLSSISGLVKKRGKVAANSAVRNSFVAIIASWIVTTASVYLVMMRVLFIENAGVVRAR